MGLLDSILGTNTAPTESETTTPIPIEGVNVWTDPSGHPLDNIVVLCELYPHLPVSERVYIKGQYDHYNGVFFTTENGPYQILDVSRWMEVK